MNLHQVVRPVGDTMFPSQYVMPVVIYPLSVVDDGSADIDWPAGTVLTGQITVTTAGTAVVGPDTAPALRVAIKAHTDNTDTVWYGNDGAGDVSSSNGFPLNPGEGVIVRGNLNQYWFDSDVNGGKICYGLVD